MKIKRFIYPLFLLVRSYWYFKVLGRKRDMSKERDCEFFEESNVNIAKFIRRDNGRNEYFAVREYDNALIEAGKTISTVNRTCSGDGHYKCYECMRLDYYETDLLPPTK